MVMSNIAAFALQNTSAKVEICSPVRPRRTEKWPDLQNRVGKSR